MFPIIHLLVLFYYSEDHNDQYLLWLDKMGFYAINHLNFLRKKMWYEDSYSDSFKDFFDSEERIADRKDSLGQRDNSDN